MTDNSTIFSNSPSTYLRDRSILVSLGVSLLINIILWILLWSKFGYSQDLIPLHFNVVYGIDFVGAARKLYQLPGAGLSILAVNFYLGKWLYEQEKLFSYFFVFVALAAQLMLAVALAPLLILNS